MDPSLVGQDDQREADRQAPNHEGAQPGGYGGDGADDDVVGIAGDASSPVRAPTGKG
jgi:hypothetical protein